ncbi:very long chain fatty acid elongase AAEL008004-like, partial [Musca autumnalis]|uniref:very long chain fatty acid elongase AAEL008004-like n=1 Tax=Musca autumnalis TaxID=221902 RepID=UPI003CF4D452
MESFIFTTVQYERITTHPVLGSPWLMFASILFYLFLILVVGKKFMENRKPFKVEKFMQLYNIVQISLNAFIFYEIVRYTIMRSDYSLKCEPYNPHDRRPATMRLVRPGVLYYVSKYLDFFDTVFFVLRKKHNQMTFLHLYHHSMILMAIFFGTSHATLAGILNSFVHVVMYSYYLIAATKPKIDLTPLKKILTSMQLIQF